jgi:catechol 2,3-dioxygenase-like lactoylglutathione lyase family enzyme
MADEKPVTPSAKQPPAGSGAAHTHPGTVRQPGAGRPGTIQVNSAAVIPAVLRGAPAPTAEPAPAAAHPRPQRNPLRPPATMPAEPGRATLTAAQPHDARSAPAQPHEAATAPPSRTPAVPSAGPSDAAPTAQHTAPPAQHTARAPRPGDGTRPAVPQSDKPGTSRGAARVPTAQGTAAVPRPAQPPSPGLQIRPVLHVADMAASVAFYEHLGAEIVHGGRDGHYTLLQLGTVQIGLLSRPADAAPGEGTVELNFCAAMPLDDLERLLLERRMTVEGIATHREFGPELRVRTPDGLLIRIHQLEPDAYL